MAKRKKQPTKAKPRAKAKAKVVTPKKQLLLEAPKKNLRYYIAWIPRHKKISILYALFTLLVLVTVLPATRYVLPRLFIKKDLSFVIQDVSGQTRISEADVSVDGKLYTSDQNGVIKASGIRPGSTTITISKMFYEPFSENLNVSPFSNKQSVFSLKSTGRPAKITIKNRLSGRALSGVLIKTESGSQAKTGKDGTAMLVLPSNKTEEKATISGDLIVTADVLVRAVQDDSTNLYRSTPKGRIYFLSKASGTLDVIKSNLDGSDRVVVLAGTGREYDTETQLSASKDWKYLALRSHRDGQVKLYLIDTTTDKVSVIDEGAADLQQIGWIDDSYVYVVRRETASWSPKHYSIKSYKATTKQSATLDDSRGEGTSPYDYSYEVFSDYRIVDKQIFYTKTWSASYYYGSHLADKKITVTGIAADSVDKKTLKEWQAGYYSSIITHNGDNGAVNIQVKLDGGFTSNWKYAKGVVVEAPELTGEDFYTAAIEYIASPNGKNLFWSEARDGKNAFMIGDKNAENSKQIATLSGYKAYGWFTNDYVLLSKDGSELFIMGREGIKQGDSPTKIY